MDGTAQNLIEYRADAPITIGSVVNSTMLDGNAVTRFGEQLFAYCGEHPGIQLLLDFAHVDYLSSAALAELIRTNDIVVANGGGLRIAGLSPSIYNVFEITKFNKVFDIHAGESAEHAAVRFKRSLALAAEEDAWQDQ